MLGWEDASVGKNLACFASTRTWVWPQNSCKIKSGCCRIQCWGGEGGGLRGSLASHPNLHGAFKASKRPRLKTGWMALEEQRPELLLCPPHVHIHMHIYTPPHKDMCTHGGLVLSFLASHILIIWLDSEEKHPKCHIVHERTLPISVTRQFQLWDSW